MSEYGSIFIKNCCISQLTRAVLDRLLDLVLSEFLANIGRPLDDYRNTSAKVSQHVLSRILTWSEEVECAVVVILVDVRENIVDLRANLFISAQDDDKEPLGTLAGKMV